MSTDILNTLDSLMAVAMSIPLVSFQAANFSDSRVHGNRQSAPALYFLCIRVNLIGEQRQCLRGFGSGGRLRLIQDRVNQNGSPCFGGLPPVAQPVALFGSQRLSSKIPTKRSPR